jgi:hypothetical protein
MISEKKEYEPPRVYLEEYDLDTSEGGICSSGVDPIPEVWTEE